MPADTRVLAALLVARSRLRRRDRWSAQDVQAHQERALRELLEFAAARSPYYAERLPRAPSPELRTLPVLTKTDLMDQWDQICTRPGLTLSATEDRLRLLRETGESPGRAWDRRWWLAATGGTTGRRAVLVWDRREWVHILASYARVNDWAGLKVSLRHPMRTAIVSSLDPTHQSAVVGASLRSSLVPTLRLDARRPLEELIAELNDFQPRLLVAYASMVGPLAAAQLAGELRMAPERVIAASEVLPDTSRTAAQRAWGSCVVVDTYAATEAAGIAATCPEGGWHLYEDLVIVEPVDVDYQPVPDGEASERLLVTPLFARTLPLIRYELTDSVRLSTAGCPCGLPFRLLQAVEGRTEDTLTLPGHAGPVRVYPVLFHSAIEPFAPGGWQVEQQPAALLIRVVVPSVDSAAIRERVIDALRGLGALDTTIQVVPADALVRTALGKAPLVKALPSRG